MEFDEYLDRLNDAADLLDAEKLRVLLVSLASSVAEEKRAAILKEIETEAYPRVEAASDTDRSQTDWENSVRKRLSNWLILPDSDRYIVVERNSHYDRIDYDESEYWYDDPNYIVDDLERLLADAGKAADLGEWNLARDIITGAVNSKIRIEGDDSFDEGLSFLKEAGWEDGDLFTPVVHKILLGILTNPSSGVKEKAKEMFDLVLSAEINPDCLEDLEEEAKGKFKFDHKFLSEWLNLVFQSDRIRKDLKEYICCGGLRILSDEAERQNLFLKMVQDYPEQFLSYYEKLLKNLKPVNKTGFLKKAAGSQKIDSAVRAELLDYLADENFKMDQREEAADCELQAFKLVPEFSRYLRAAYYIPSAVYLPEIDSVLKQKSNLPAAVILAAEGHPKKLIKDIRTSHTFDFRNIAFIFGMISEGELNNDSLQNLLISSLISENRFASNKGFNNRQEFVSMFISLFSRTANRCILSKQLKRDLLAVCEKRIKDEVDRILMVQNRNEYSTCVRLIDALGYAMKVSGNRNAYRSLRDSYQPELKRYPKFREEFNLKIKTR